MFVYKLRSTSNAVTQRAQSPSGLCWRSEVFFLQATVFWIFRKARMPLPNWAIITGACILPNVGGWVGGLITRSQIKSWYEALKKPSWRPPNWAFGPVWTTLYTSMGYASYLVWSEGGGFNETTKIPLMLYGTQLALNWAWTPIFFGSHKLGAALVEITFLWAGVAGCIYTFYPISKLAAGLLVPYIGWVSLATALNYNIWQMNKPAIKEE